MDCRVRKKIDIVAQKSRETAENPVVRAYTSIFTTFDIIESYVRSSLKDDEISRAGKNILHILIINGGSLTATEISRHVWRSKFATTRVIDTLVKGGYVTRNQPDSHGDRRKKMITITNKGVELSEKTDRISTENLCHQVLKGLTEEQLAHLTEIMEHIGRNTFELIDSPDNPFIYRKP